MNVCEHCDESFPNIVELYRHKYKSHQQSLVLYNHLGSDRARGEEGSQEVVSFNPGKEITQYDPSTSQLNVTLNGKRKLENIDLEDHHVVKRKRGGKAYNRVHKIKPASKHNESNEFHEPEKKIEIVDADKKEVIQVDRSNNQDEAVDINEPMDIKPVVEIDYKNLYEVCRMELKAQEEKFRQAMSKIKKECGRDIIKIKKKFKKREQDLKKDLFAQKRHYDENIKEMESFHQDNVTLLKGKIKSLKEDDISFRPLSEAIFNCITIEEIYKIKSLLKQHKIEELIENHLDTLQKLFLSLSHGVIPLCQPQRDVISDFQRSLIEKIETSTPVEAKELILQNIMEIINLFSIIDQSLQLATNSYKKFVKN